MSRVVGVVERLLHAVADAVVVVLGLDQRERDVGLEIEDVVGALGLAARDQLAAHDDAALGEADLFADLRHLIPARLPQGGRDELGADVAFAEGALVPVFALASCDEYGRICNSERDRRVVTPKNCPDPRGQGRLSLGGCRPESGRVPRPAPRRGIGPGGDPYELALDRPLPQVLEAQKLVGIVRSISF